MTYATATPDDIMRFSHDRSTRRLAPQIAVAAVGLVCSALVGMRILDAERPATAPKAQMPRLAAPHTDARRAVARPATAAANPYGALIDPTFSLGVAPMTLAQSAPLAARFVSRLPAEPDPIVVADAEPEIVLPSPAPVVPEIVTSLSPPAPAASPVVETVPLPIPRPLELRFAEIQAPVRSPARPMGPRQSRTVRTAAAPPDNRNFFEKVFGIEQPSGPVLAYAAPEPSVINNARTLLSRPAVGYDRYTAVYDIAAHTVYMPNGARLEAHSGLGGLLDDPRHVAERNRGATPPALYDLQPREQLFHGVQALRLNPVGGNGVFGRTGLLAHTYMLGPNGDSNGCVSFRDYNAFLQAFANGEIRHLAVVARSS